jgi:ribosomal protein S18 acetylase RimI-like enzyme
MTMRPIKMPKDLETLKEIAYESFQYPENPEWGLQEDEKESATSQLDAFRRIWPLLRAVGLIYPPLRDLFGGYIWEEEDKAAGLVMLQPSSPTGSSAWIVGTVAVLPTFRRRGIARKLVTAGLEYAKEKGAETIMLDVFSKNLPAYELYKSVGFSHFATGLELSCEADVPLPDAQPLPDGYQIAATPRSDWRPRFELAQRITPDTVKTYRPIQKSSFNPPLLVRTLIALLEKLQGTVDKIYIVRDSDMVVAVARYDARRKEGGVNQLRITLDPARPELSPYLVSMLVHEVMERSPGRRIGLLQFDWGMAVIEASLSMGFTKRNEWHEMGMVVE